VKAKQEYLFKSIFPLFNLVKAEGRVLEAQPYRDG